MKTLSYGLAAVLAACTLGACDYFSPARDERGEICVSFSRDDYLMTRAASDLPDTNAFILTVTSSKGSIIYHGIYGAAPDPLLVDPGSYTVEAVSGEVHLPAFSAPLYGDRQVLAVKEGECASVRLNCMQMNAGVRLEIAPSFLTDLPDAVLYLRSSAGKLMYGYSEKRIAYFEPGPVSLVMSDGSGETTLFTRSLQSREILTLKVNTAGPQGGTAGGVSVQVDTTRIWSSAECLIGGASEAGDSRSNAMGVDEARGRVGATDVWVYGYIVGGDLTSSKASFSGPFSSKTNIVLATRSSVTSRENCLSVQLRQGDIRDALNLVDNPANLGRQVFLKGTIVDSYYGLPGIQDITDYTF